MQRTNMGIAILCMVNHTSIESDQLIRSSISSKADKCYLEQKNSTLTVHFIINKTILKKNYIF